MNESNKLERLLGKLVGSGELRMEEAIAIACACDFATTTENLKEVKRIGGDVAIAGLEGLTIVSK